MLSVIIVNWNVKYLIVKNLQSIFNFTKNLDFEVIVVDNGSSDGSVELMQKEFSAEIGQKKLLIINTKQNNGFAKGNNLGVDVASGEYLLFMNPDMELVENSFEILLNHLENHKNIDVLGCTLVYGDKSIQKTVKNLPTFLSQVFVLLKLHHLFKNSKTVKDYLNLDFDYTLEQKVEQLMGAFILMKREVFEKVGRWSEDYWMWWDDVDLAYQFQKQKLNIFYTPITKIIHHESKSFEQVKSLERQKRFNKGMLIYFKKYGQFWQYLVLLLLQPISFFLAWITQVFKIKMKQQSKIG
jgi:GT2 family glycosyltransferase